MERGERGTGRRGRNRSVVRRKVKRGGGVQGRSKGKGVGRRGGEGGGRTVGGKWWEGKLGGEEGEKVWEE